MCGWGEDWTPGKVGAALAQRRPGRWNGIITASDLLDDLRRGVLLTDDDAHRLAQHGVGEVLDGWEHRGGEEAALHVRRRASGKDLVDLQEGRVHGWKVRTGGCDGMHGCGGGWGWSRVGARVGQGVGQRVWARTQLGASASSRSPMSKA